MVIINKSTDIFLIIMAFGCIKIFISMLVNHKHIKIITLICIYIKFFVEQIAVGFSIYCYKNTKELFYIAPIILQIIVCGSIIVYICNFDKLTTLKEDYYCCNNHVDSCKECICSICLESYHDDIIYNLPCNHIFHKTCLDDWLKQKKNCPLCRFHIIIE